MFKKREPPRREKDGSVLWDLGPHDLSILNYLLGEVPIRVSARGRSMVRLYA